MNQAHRAASSFLAAAVQMNSGLDKTENLAAAGRLIEEAAGRGARLVVLPEHFAALGPIEAMVPEAEPIPGPTSRAMAALAARHNIFLLAGSFCEKSTTPGKAYNTSLLFGPEGQQIACYRKMHLFDVDLPDKIIFRESQYIDPGTQLVTAPTELGQLGLATCFDLRFPELFRGLIDLGMEVLLFPSAFVKSTGLAHWEVLLRARAIENQIHVIAANQCGQHAPRLTTFGHSMIIDPWGEVLARRDDGEGLVLAEINPARQATLRRELPALANRRLGTIATERSLPDQGPHAL